MARLPGTVIAFGIVSFLTDLSSEMIFPLLPTFVVSLGAGGAFVGLIEGVAETTSAFLKLVSGVWADRVRRRKPLVVVGYGIASVARPLVAVAQAPWHVLGIRFTDRIGKGLRSSPRDAMIAAVTEPHRRGAAYGFHRAMDHAGALVGPLVAFLLLHAAGLPVRTVFALAAVPAVVAMVVLIAGVRESVRLPIEPPPPTVPPPAAFAEAPRPHAAPPHDAGALRRYLVAVAIFTLANASDAFLLLRAADAGLPTALAPLLWAAHHAVKSSLATPLGAISDRLGRRGVIVSGWLVFAVTYLGFARASSTWHVWVLMAFYGVHFALVEGAEKALVADLAPPDRRGRAFGAFHFVVGICALPASLGFGTLWQWLGPETAFYVSAALATVAAVLLFTWVPIPPASWGARRGSAKG